MDDGNRDFYQVAWPVFAAYGLPVTVYLVTGFLDGELRLWTDQVRYALSQTKVPRLAMELPAHPPLTFSLRSDEERLAAAISPMKTWICESPNGSSAGTF